MTFVLAQGIDIINDITISYGSAQCCFDAAGGTANLRYSKFFLPNIVYKGQTYDYYVSNSDYVL